MVGWAPPIRAQIKGPTGPLGPVRLEINLTQTACEEDGRRGQQQQPGVISAEVRCVCTSELYLNKCLVFVATMHAVDAKAAYLADN